MNDYWLALVDTIKIIGTLAAVLAVVFGIPFAIESYFGPPTGALGICGMTFLSYYLIALAGRKGL